MVPHEVKYGLCYGNRTFAAVFNFSYHEPDKSYSLSWISHLVLGLKSCLFSSGCPHLNSVRIFIFPLCMPHRPSIQPSWSVFSNNTQWSFDVLLTVHLSIILAIDQLNAQILDIFKINLYSSTCFEHFCAHHQEVKLYYTASGIVTICRWPGHLQSVTIPDAI